jgi:hypothetical protein
MKWFIIILILAIVLIAGCTNVICKSDWVLAGSVWDISGWPIRNAEMCKSSCYSGFGTTSFKIENDNCYCDVNKCS